jgi:hypothetical protein
MSLFHLPRVEELLEWRTTSYPVQPTVRRDHGLGRIKIQNTDPCCDIVCPLAGSHLISRRIFFSRTTFFTMQIINLFNVIFAWASLFPVAADVMLRGLSHMEEDLVELTHLDQESDAKSHKEPSHDPMEPAMLEPPPPVDSVDPLVPLLPLEPAQLGSCDSYPNCVTANVTGECCPVSSIIIT